MSFKDQKFWSKVNKTETCWLWIGAKLPNGYGVLTREYKQKYAHRHAYELAYGKPPSGLHVCHHCDVRHCVRPDHLFVGTRSDNMQDMIAKGRAPNIDRKGERNAAAKITDEHVREIRAHAALSGKELAHIYGISPQTVSSIRNYKTWVHV